MYIKNKTKIHTLAWVFQASMFASPNKLGDEMIIELAEISVEEDFEIRQKHTKDSYFKMKLAWLDREVRQQTNRSSCASEPDSSMCTYVRERNTCMWKPAASVLRSCMVQV
jgi:hypothetical protein